jgi:signal transduction histidine kinase
MSMQTEGLNSHEVLRFASVIAVGVTLLLTSAASYFLDRQHNRRPLFALTMLLIAWSTVALGSATSGVGRLFPPVLVAAPLLSGFTGPALFIYTRQLTTPERPASLWWLALGLFGTTYSVLSLVIPAGLDGAIQALVYPKPYWHPLLSPLMVIQSLQLVTFALLSTGLITWAYVARSRPDLRQTQFWLLVICWTTVCIVVLTNVLPNFKILLTQVEPAVMTLPFAVVGCLSVRALGAELTSRHEEQVEIRAQRMESLGRMARGMAHDLNNVLAAVVGHAELAAMKLPTGAPAAQHLQQVLEGSEQAAALMKRMMTYSGRVDRSHPAIDPRAHLEAAFQALAPLQGPACRMSLALEDGLPLARIDPSS